MQFIDISDFISRTSLMPTGSLDQLNGYSFTISAIRLLNLYNESNYQKHLDFHTNKFICEEQEITAIRLLILLKANYWKHREFHTKNFIYEKQETGGRLNKKDGLTRYGDSHVKDKTS